METINQLNRDPLAGGLAESWAILEYLKMRWNQGKEAPIYFFRDRHGSEVDLLIATGRALVAVEIKAGQTFSAHFLKSLKRFGELAGPRLKQNYVIYNGPERGQIKDATLLGFEQVEQLLR